MVVVSWWNLQGGVHVPRGPGGSREYLGKGPSPGSGRCFNCGIDGHWARDCKAGDWKNKCYRCGERGHFERNCHSSPKSLRPRRNYSRSPSPRRGRNRSRSYRRGRSYSRSRSPPRSGGHNTVRERSRSPDYSSSPKSRKSPPPSEGRKRGLSPDGSRSPREQVSASPKRREDAELNGSGYSGSPGRRDSQSPMSPERETSPVDCRHTSPETKWTKRQKITVSLPEGVNPPRTEDLPINETLIEISNIVA